MSCRRQEVLTQKANTGLQFYFLLQIQSIKGNSSPHKNKALNITCKFYKTVVTDIQTWIVVFKFQTCCFYCIVFLSILASEKLSLMHIHLLSWHYFVPILFLFISYSLGRALLKSILLKTLLWFSLLIHTYPFVTTFIILADVVALFSNAPGISPTHIFTQKQLHLGDRHALNSD